VVDGAVGVDLAPTTESERCLRLLATRRAALGPFDDVAVGDQGEHGGHGGFILGSASDRWFVPSVESASPDDVSRRHLIGITVVLCLQLDDVVCYHLDDSVAPYQFVLGLQQVDDGLAKRVLRGRVVRAGGVHLAPFFKPFADFESPPLTIWTIPTSRA
jgi:hypothetical protein